MIEMYIGSQRRWHSLSALLFSMSSLITVFIAGILVVKIEAVLGSLPECDGEGRTAANPSESSIFGPSL